MEFLVGFRFHPTDTELIVHYLSNRIKGLCKFPMIQECDIYMYEPWNLPCDSFRLRNENKEMYFFTPRHPSSGCPQRASRTAGNGYWKGYGKDRLIKIGSAVVGHKTALTYKLLNEEEEMKTNWIMHEYRLSGSRKEKKFDDLVLCRIHEKKRSLEEIDDNVFIVEGKQVEEPEKQCLMDSTNNSCSRCLPVSDLLLNMIKKVPNLDDTGVSNMSSKKRKAADKGSNKDESSSKKQRTSCSNSEHSALKIQDDSGTSTISSSGEKNCGPKFSDEDLGAREQREEIDENSNSCLGGVRSFDLNEALDGDGDMATLTLFVSEAITSATISLEEARRAE